MLHYTVYIMLSSSPQHRTQIYLPDLLYKTVKTLAHEQNVSIAQVIRDAITKYTLEDSKREQLNLTKAKRELLKLAGAGKGPKDLAKNHDSYW